MGTILSGGRLNDKHINSAHQILKKQIPNLTGLQSTLLLSKSQQMSATTTTSYLQIIHTNGNPGSLLPRLEVPLNSGLRLPVNITAKLDTGVNEKTVWNQCMCGNGKQS